MAAMPAVREVRGACPLDCPDTCSWVARVEDGRVVDLRGDRAHPFTRGVLCGKVDHYVDALHDPRRLLHPLRRVGPKGAGRFERCTWDEALDLVADGLRRAAAEHGPESVLPYYFAGTAGLLQGWSLGPRLFAALGASRLDTTICTAAAEAAMDLTLGGSVGPDPEDLGHARLVVIWGGNPVATNLHQWRFVLDARRRGAHVVAIDPLRTETAARCDEHLALLPGTDAALALGLMRVVLDGGAVDRDWLERHALGWPELEARLADWPPERAAAVCGVDVARVRALGDRLAAVRPTAIRVGLGLQRHAGAAAAVRAILAIPAVTGDWRHLGGGALCMTQGHLDVLGPTVDVPGLDRPPARTVNMSRLAETLTEADDPPVRAIVVFDANPAATAPDGERLRRGLARDDLFTVVLEQRPTDTTDWADVVLPATMQPEHTELMASYGHLYLSWNEPAVPPPGEALPNTEIFRRLARRMGLEHPALHRSDLELAAELLDTDAARARGVTLDRLRVEGWIWAADFPRGTPPFADGGFPTPSGRVELWSPRLAATGADGLVGFVPPAEVLDEALAERFPLVLLSTASRFLMNSTFGSLPWHRGHLGEPVVYLHPDDAGPRGLADGDPVRVANDRGAFDALCAVSDATRPGVACTFRTQWRRLSPDGRNVNATTPVRDTDVGGGPTFQDNRVEVRRRPEPAA